jgi:hypothetical protein
VAAVGAAAEGILDQAWLNSRAWMGWGSQSRQHTGSSPRCAAS